MSWELVVARKKMLMARSKSSGDLNRANELKKEIRRIEEENGKESEPEDTDLPKEEKPSKEIRDEFYPCPCGCGQTPEGEVFMPGHDGRVCGWIRKIDTGKYKPGQFTQEIHNIHAAWVKDGSPGGNVHPRIKRVVQKMRDQK
jgi:hypothetical protein